MTRPDNASVMSNKTSEPDQAPNTEQLREITWQSVIGACLVSAIVAGAYPYIVLKLGYGPNASVVSAFLGAMFLNLTAFHTKGRNRFLNNIIQTAGTSAASTAFMCIIAAAFGYLEKNETINLHVQIAPWPMFAWLTCSGMLGVVFTVFFRTYFLDDPQMIFASGMAAAETIKVLDAQWKDAQNKIRALGLTAVVSAGVYWLREGMAVLTAMYISQPFRAGIEWSCLSFGSGLLIGPHVGLSMLLGTFVTAFVIGPWVISSGIGNDIIKSQIAPAFWDNCQKFIVIANPSVEQTNFIKTHCGLLTNFYTHKYFPIVVSWAMWPATALMVAATVTTLVLKWRSIVNLFTTLQIKKSSSEKDMSLQAILTIASVLIIALIVVQYNYFQLSVLETVVAVAASLPLMLVAIRVKGETNIGPVSTMSNALQAIFAIFWPAQISSNLIAAGIAGTITSQAEETIQDYKTGRIVGSTPRTLTYVQLAAVPIGAAAVAIMYPILIDRYGLGGDGLSAPTGLKIANMGVLLSLGIDALPKYALIAALVATVAGVVISVILERSKSYWTTFIPSVTGFGFALILPGELNIPIALGGIGGWLWMKLSSRTFNLYAVTIASGMIAGEAILGGLILPLLTAFGVHIK